MMLNRSHPKGLLFSSLCQDTKKPAKMKWAGFFSEAIAVTARREN